MRTLAMREHVFCLRKYQVFVLSYRLSYRLSYNCLIDCLIIVLYVLLDVLQGSHKSCSGMLEPAPRGSPRPRKFERDSTDRSSASWHLFQCEAHWLRKCNRGRMGRPSLPKTVSAPVLQATNMRPRGRSSARPGLFRLQLKEPCWVPPEDMRMILPLFIKTSIIHRMISHYS